MKIRISLDEQEDLWEQFHRRLSSGGSPSACSWTRGLTIADIIKYLHVEWAAFEDFMPSGPAPTFQPAATLHLPGNAARPEPTTVRDFLDHLVQPYSIDGAQSRKFQHRADRPRICVVKVRRGAGRNQGVRVVGSGWKRHLPRDPVAPVFILPPWAQPEKTEMSFHCCDVRDLVYLLGAHRQACGCILASRQRLGLLHVLHALETIDDNQDVFSTVVVKAIVERSWCLVRCQYYLKFCTAIVSIVGLGWFTHQTNHREPVSMVVVDILTVISVVNIFKFGAELLSFVLEFHHTDIFSYLSVWNALSGISEFTLLCVLIGLRLEPTLFLQAEGFMTVITVVNWYNFVIYTMSLQIGYCLVPAWRALLSTDSISILMALGVLVVGASMCLYTMPFDTAIIFFDAAQLMFRVCTVGDGDSIFQVPEDVGRIDPKGNYGHYVFLVVYFLFCMGFGTAVCMQLYASILACSYEEYRSRADHHYNKHLVNVMIKFFLQSCLFDRLLFCNAGPRRLKELEQLFGGLRQPETEEPDTGEPAPPGTVPGLLVACRQDDTAARRTNGRKLQGFMHMKLRGCGFLLDCRNMPLLGNFAWSSRNNTVED